MQISYLFVAAVMALGVSAHARNGTGTASPTGGRTNGNATTTGSVPAKQSIAGGSALVAQAGVAGLGVAFAAFL